MNFYSKEQSSESDSSNSDISENENDEDWYECLFMAMDSHEECSLKGNNIVYFEDFDEEEAEVKLEAEL
ncbi:hypothetical protein KI387_005684, partial [Taxus chinensis]